MKKLISFVAIVVVFCCVAGCNETNPASSSDSVGMVKVVLFAKRHDSFRIYSDGNLVSLLQKRNESDTVTVENGAVLKAKWAILVNGAAEYHIDVNEAVAGLIWEL